MDDHTVIGIGIRDLSTGEEFSVKGDQQFSQTGLSKLHILMALYREASEGRVDLSSRHTLSNKEKLPGGVLHRLGDDSVTMSIRDYAMLMTVMDDNSAANVLLAKIGTQAIDNYLAALGTKDIRFAGLVTDPKNPEDNTATPLALAQCLDSLHRCEIVDKNSRDDIYSLLSTPRVSALRTGLPPNMKVASKSGFRGPLRCAAGIVFLKKHPYAIVVMIRPTMESRENQRADANDKIAAISRLAYSYFGKLEGTPPEQAAAEAAFTPPVSEIP